MDRDEILELSRKENQNRDLAELDVEVRAGNLGARVGAAVCCLVSALFLALTGMPTFSPWIIYCSIFGTKYVVRYRGLRRKDDLIFCVLFFVLGLVALVFFVLRLAGIVG